MEKFFFLFFFRLLSGKPKFLKPNFVYWDEEKLCCKIFLTDIFQKLSKKNRFIYLQLHPFFLDASQNHHFPDNDN